MKSLLKEMYILKFFIKRVWKASPSYVMASTAESFLGAMIPFITILFPKYMIDEMMGEKRISLLAAYVLIAVLIGLILSMITSCLKRYMKVTTRDVMIGFEADIGSHNMGVEYKNLEDPKYIELKDRAMMPIRERATHYFMVHYLPDMLKYLITAIGSLCILISFDIISLIVVLIPTAVIVFLNKEYQKKDILIQKENSTMNRFFMYYYGLVEDFSAAKDIRIFQLHPLLMKRNNECDDRIFTFKKRASVLKGKFDGQSRILEAFRSAFTYGYIGVKSILYDATIGSFTMYIRAASTFSDSTAKILNIFIQLRQDCRYLEEFVQLEELPVETGIEGRKDVDLDNGVLEFKHVSFCYPGTEREVLKDVSFKLRQGESLSIVGRNGAGKTTIIKLLSRLFQPTSGNIMINGIDINSIDIAHYRDLLSVVFQDFKTFEFSIEDNVTSGEKVIEKQLTLALEKSGLEEKVQSLPQGINTNVGKRFDNNGTEFSGGELQKLAIARALYKNASVIVLDEPTAALDPYAELEVYERFHDMMENHTVVYISHRLSSCKFCQRIIFLEDGSIIEDGNHDELINLNGKYSEMFQMQASQYVS
jgi:ABC-type multidrug transport system fused ATPase/permease subunit